MKKATLALFLALGSCDKPVEQALQRPQDDRKWTLNYQQCSEAYDFQKDRIEFNKLLNSCLSSFAGRKVDCPPDKGPEACYFAD